MGELNSDCEKPERPIESCERKIQNDELNGNLLFNLAGDAILVADADTGLLVKANKKAEQLLGIPIDEIATMHQSQLHPQEEIERYKELFQKHCQMNSGSILGECFVCHKDGHRIPVEISTSIVSLGNRKFIYGIFRDITDRKQAEDVLRKSENRLDLLAEKSRTIIWQVDAEGLFTHFSRVAEKILGYWPEEVIGKKHFYDLHPEDGRAAFKAAAFEIFARKEPFIEFENPVETKDGHVVLVSTNGIPILNANGELAGYQGSDTDITKRRHAKEELMASQDRFKRLAEASFEGIAIHKDGMLLDVNQQYLDMFGYTLEECYAAHGLDMIAPQSRDLVKNSIASGYEGKYEVLGLRKDGSIFPIEIRVRLSSLDGQSVRIAVIRDLTERKKMEEDLLESEKKYRLLYTNAQVALYRNRLSDSKLLECNEALVAQLGYDSREHCLAECYAKNHYANPSRRAEFLEKLKKEGFLENYEIEIIRRDGIHAWVKISARLYPEEGYVEGSQIDITAAKLLTRTEKKILALVLQGKCSKEIAECLNRSIRTIEDHRGHIMHKLGVDSLVELTKRTFFFVHEMNK